MIARGIPPHLLYIEKILKVEVCLDKMEDRLVKIEDTLSTLHNDLVRIETEGITQVGPEWMEQWMKEGITAVLGTTRGLHGDVVQIQNQLSSSSSVDLTTSNELVANSWKSLKFGELKPKS